MSGNKMLCAVKNAAGSIHLVNKCLVIFMAVLLLQSAYSLFYPEESGGEAGNIDVIVRTSSAAIFGYFLSANFDCRTGKSSSNTGDGTAKALPSTVGEGPKTQIGFQAPSPDGEDPIQMPPEIRAADSSECNPQVIIATVIGLFCLLVLVLVRRLGIPENSSATATVVQFRDFVSGCVGFLIGCSTDSLNQSEA